MILTVPPVIVGLSTSDTDKVLSTTITPPEYITVDEDPVTTGGSLTGFTVICKVAEAHALLGSQMVTVAVTKPSKFAAGVKRKHKPLIWENVPDPLKRL